MLIVVTDLAGANPRRFRPIGVNLDGREREEEYTGNLE